MSGKTAEIDTQFVVNKYQIDKFYFEKIDRQIVTLLVYQIKRNVLFSCMVDTLFMFCHVIFANVEC